MRNAADIARLLEDTFVRIERERMVDVPILNRRIQVEAVAFRQWQDVWLGVLVTPWFMNLMLLPMSADASSDGQPGASESVAFPCGDIDCLHGYEDGIGSYRMCSLYSPMFDFEDHAAAVATAQAVLAGVLEPAEQAAPAAPPKTAATMSRRELLRGRLGS
jgi:[NiFe] hydrogenase assembly HybE family chaperone